jgi:hypothetical protein
MQKKKNRRKGVCNEVRHAANEKTEKSGERNQGKTQPRTQTARKQNKSQRTGSEIDVWPSSEWRTQRNTLSYTRKKKKEETVETLRTATAAPTNAFAPSLKLCPLPPSSFRPALFRAPQRCKDNPNSFCKSFFFLCACVCPPFPFFVCSTANAAGDCDRIPAQIENSNKRKRDKKKEEQPQPLHHFPLALHRHVVLAEGMNATQPELHARVRRGREGERAEDSAGGEPLCGHHRGCCAY